MRRQIVAARSDSPPPRSPTRCWSAPRELCMALGTDGIRGELTLIRASRALAALEGAAPWSTIHLRRVAATSLRHRLRRNPLDDTGATVRVERAIAELFARMSAAATDLAASARVPDAGGRRCASRSSRLVRCVCCRRTDRHRSRGAGRSGAARPRRAGARRLADAAARVRSRRALPPHSLGITDDRLLGGLDLAATFGRAARRRARHPRGERRRPRAPRNGRADPRGDRRAHHRRAGRGAVCLERDGLASVTKTRFGVIALDEGIGEDEQVAPATCRTPGVLPRPRLCQRSGVAFDVRHRTGGGSGSLDLPSPAEIAFARALLPAIRPDGSALEALCHRGHRPRIDSCRAPLLALRAARAAAALEGRTDIEDDDILLAARLVLAPRATRLPPDQASAPEQQADPGQQDQAEQDEPDAGHARRCTGHPARQHRRR